MRSWFITGASSGIGLALAQAAAGKGDNVVALARRTDALTPLTEQYGAQVLAVGADVRSPEQLRAAVAAAIRAFGRIDVVANNAGYGLFGAVEESTDAQARSIFDTNLFGVLNVLRAVLPVLRAQGSGHILQGSSYYGQTAHPGVGLLAATKYAVEGLTDALGSSVRNWGEKSVRRQYVQRNLRKRNSEEFCDDSFLVSPLKHRFSVGLCKAGAQTTPTVPAYQDGTLDWTGFTAGGDTGLQATVDRETLLSTVFPDPLRFPGLPPAGTGSSRTPVSTWAASGPRPPTWPGCWSPSSPPSTATRGASSTPASPLPPCDLFAEEVPREDVTLTRARQYACAADGRGLLWTTCRARPGRGEYSSGLRFDHLEEQGCRSAAQPGRLSAAPARRHGE